MSRARHRPHRPAPSQRRGGGARGGRWGGRRPPAPGGGGAQLPPLPLTRGAAVRRRTLSPPLPPLRRGRAGPELPPTGRRGHGCPAASAAARRRRRRNGVPALARRRAACGRQPPPWEVGWLEGEARGLPWASAFLPGPCHGPLRSRGGRPGSGGRECGVTSSTEPAPAPPRRLAKAGRTFVYESCCSANSVRHVCGPLTSSSLGQAFRPLNK